MILRRNSFIPHDCADRAGREAPYVRRSLGAGRYFCADVSQRKRPPEGGISVSCLLSQWHRVARRNDGVDLVRPTLKQLPSRAEQKIGAGPVIDFLHAALGMGELDFDQV